MAVLPKRLVICVTKCCWSLKNEFTAISSWTEILYHLQLKKYCPGSSEKLDLRLKKLILFLLKTYWATVAGTNWITKHKTSWPTTSLHGITALLLTSSTIKIYWAPGAASIATSMTHSSQVWVLGKCWDWQRNHHGGKVNTAQRHTHQTTWFYGMT